MEEYEALEIHNTLHTPTAVSVLFRGTSYPIKFHPSNDCRSCHVFGAKFMTQNTFKKTAYAQRARSGEKLTWVMGGEPWGLIANDRIETYPIIINRPPTGSKGGKSGSSNSINNNNNNSTRNTTYSSNSSSSNNNNNNNNKVTSFYEKYKSTDSNGNDMAHHNDIVNGTGLTEQFKHNNTIDSNSLKNGKPVNISNPTFLQPSIPIKSEKKDTLNGTPTNISPTKPPPPIKSSNSDAPTAKYSDRKDQVMLDDLMNSPAKRMKLMESFEIPYSELQLYNVLGTGSFGVVRKGKWRGTEVAVKVLTNKKQKSVDLFQQEAELMCKLRHPNIVQILGVSKQTGNGELCIVMEYLGQTLKQMINAYGGLQAMPFPIFLLIAKGIACGINYLHKSQPPILHRDLKPANILLDSHNIPRVADFGVSRTKQKTSTMTKIGTPYYMAPEILMGKSYNEKVDVYSYAMILFQMVSGKVPFAKMGSAGEDLSPIQIIMKVGVENLRPQIPAFCPAGISKLITLAWDRDPATRPSFSKIILLLESFEVDGGLYFPDDLLRLDEDECEKTLVQTLVE